MKSEVNNCESTSPNRWTNKKLDELGFVGRGKSKHRPRNDISLYGGNYPFVQTGNVKAAEFYLNEYSQTYNDKGLAQSKLWNPGTLCITIAANIADTAILKIKACFPDSVVGFVADPLKADVRFIKYYIDTIKLSMQNVSKGTTQDNLSLDKLRIFDFAVPPLETQHKIATILSTYDNLIENNTRRIKILEEMAQTIYREWFVNFRFPGHEKVKMVGSSLGEIPEGWEVKTICSFGEVITGKTPSKKVPENFNGETPFIKTPDMHGNIFCIDTTETLSALGVETQKKKTIPANSLCVSCIGTPGVITITTEPAQTNQQINSIVLHAISTREFLYFALDGLRETMSQHGSSGATMFNLSKGKFEALQVVCPESSCMRRYHQATATMFNQISMLQRKNRNIRQTRNLLLPKLISGSVDVSEFEVAT